jgi:hypothetical protein
MKPITLDTVVCKNDDIFSGAIDDEMVAINIENGKYYQMNRTGSRLLSLLDRPSSIRELCEKVIGSYKVDPDVLNEEVLEFMQDMVKYKVVLTV